MATDVGAQLTLVELANRIDPDGDTATIAEILNEENPILDDMPWVEGNGIFSHTYTRRLNLPTGTWRKLNKGVPTESSQTIKATEVMGILESYAEADKRLVDAAPNPEAFRMSEAVAFLEGMSQTMAAAIIYGNASTDPEKITGLAPRLNTVNGINVIDNGGSGTDVTSIYIVQWNPEKVFAFYPRGHKTFGVQRQDLGERTLTDDDGNLYQGYRDHFVIECGLAVKDERCVARVANIEVSGATAIFDEDNLIKALNKMPGQGKGAVIYMPEVIKTQAEIALKDKTNTYFQPAEGEGLAGVPFMRFRGNPVKVVDAILSTETAIS